MGGKFPIYHIDFTLYAGENELAGCEQDMMVLEEFVDHDAALLSLYRVVTNLAKELDVTDIVTSWVGSITLARHDSWCCHRHSHYTYRYFSEQAAALADFLCWATENEQLEKIGSEMSEWKVCHCEKCRMLYRTMILHSGESICG